MFYYSLIYPYFYHCNVVWASAYKSDLRRLVILQKHIIRIPVLINHIAMLIQTPSSRTSVYLTINE